MTSKNLAWAILVTLPLTAAIACGGGGGSTATGGQATTASSSSSGSAGNATTSSSTSSGTSGTTTSSSTSGTTTSSSTSGTTSSSSSSTSSGATGACQDAADMAVNMTTVGNDASGCVTGGGCIGDYLSQNWTGLATCVATCLQGMDHTSTACSACWGTVVACGAQHCASQCAGGQSAACTTCTDQYCTPAFDTCSGE